MPQIVRESSHQRSHSLAATGDDVQSISEAEADLAQPAQAQIRPLTTIQAAMPGAPRRRKLKLTRHGTTVPSLPSSLIKRLAVESVIRRRKKRPVIDRASLKALEQAAEWFFEQVGEDLEAYSNHAGRKKRVNASDMLTLMKRQRVLKSSDDLRKLAKEHLVPEAFQELDIPETF